MSDVNPQFANNITQHLHPIPGGLYLPQQKRISCEKPLTRMPVSQTLFIPLTQHTGGVASPLVKPGQSVQKGEFIATFESPTTGFVHAPSSGTIRSISNRPVSHPSGLEGLCIELETTDEDASLTLPRWKNWQSRSPDELRDRIQQAGIVGLGGAVFPTSKKVAHARHAEIDTLIINGVECEPFISCDEVLIRSYPEELLVGALILRKATGARQLIIAVENQDKQSFEYLQRLIAEKTIENLLLIQVNTIYPGGGEKQLIQHLTGCEIPHGGHPSDIGLLVQNIATAVAVRNAVVEGMPLVERIVTVTGKGVVQPQNLIVQIGTPISKLISYCGGYTDDAARLIIGGPMMGYAISDDQNPIVKAANCILVLTPEDLHTDQEEMPCIRCGECASVCPAQLLPQTLQWQTRNQLIEDAARSGLGECIECGCCDLVCPSHIPLVDWFRFGKSELRKLEDERVQADWARRRFEARTSRLETEKQQLSQKRNAKKRALQSNTKKKKDIAAALSRVKQRNTQKAESASPEHSDSDPGNSVEP